MQLRSAIHLLGLSLFPPYRWDGRYNILYDSVRTSRWLILQSGWFSQVLVGSYFFLLCLLFLMVSLHILIQFCVSWRFTKLRCLPLWHIPPSYHNPQHVPRLWMLSLQYVYYYYFLFTISYFLMYLISTARIS